jgi:hypothetical protein
MNIPDNEMINVSYTNWRGEAKVRRVLLGRVRFGSTDWHKEPTWLINAFDLDHPAQIWKEFDLSKCDFNRDYMPENVDHLREALEEIRDGYGPNHLSKFARDVATKALSQMEPRA